MNVKKISISLMCVIFAVIVILSGCTTHYSDDLFDEQVLKYYNLSGLKKPEGAVNERSEIYTNDDTEPSHIYQCNVESVEVLNEYSEYVANALNEKNYNTAYFLRESKLGELISYKGQLVELALFTEFGDYNKGLDTTDSSVYKFYYSKKNLGGYKAEYHGKQLKNAVCITLRYGKLIGNDENNFEINVRYLRDREYAYILTDEDYLNYVIKKLNNPYIS